MKKFLNSWKGLALKILGICAAFILALYLVFIVIDCINDAPDVSNVINTDEFMFDLNKWK